jgi:tol-pal system protein YbgF
MSSRFHKVTQAAALSALLVLGSQAFAQSDDVDPEIRIQQLENQLRQLTGQNEELQYRNRQLEERLRLLQAGAPAAPGGPPAALPNAAAMPPIQPNPSPRQPQPQVGYEPQIAAPAPIVQEPAGVSPGVPPPQGRRRGDAFDPSQNPNAPGAPRALGGGQLPIPAEAPIGAPGGRGAGEPLDLANTAGAGNPPGTLPPPPRNTNATGALTTLPPSATPRDEFDLGVGYIQRKDYALAEETMRNFAKRYPSDPMIADAQYWLGESFFQRQLYRDAAESFLAVTTKFDRSAKAPDALLRLGQSLAALKEREAACAAFGEVTRKYPHASGSVKQAVDREQKRVKC